MDDISVHWYVSILVAEAGLEPAISAYETERITIFHIPLYILYYHFSHIVKAAPHALFKGIRLLPHPTDLSTVFKYRNFL